ncbi:glycosyltransferase family 2 protein [Dubosiella newyorkensis]|uniref:glycosyltransferase family 2 protein n=1 Tax=Dubosiella newyorkensis TaxID=1862672 RepID=UPI0023EF6B5E|nr:glycosyltransferase family 2 protein [Dubosiella newyorkensis]
MNKDKDFKSYIDSVEYFENKYENRIEIKGWCYADDGNSVELLGFTNGKEVKIKSYLMDRRDVFNHYGIPYKFEKIGFIVNIESKEPIKEFKLYGEYQGKKGLILQLNENKLNQLKMNTAFHLGIDHFYKNKGMYLITGYIYHPTFQPFDIKILNRKDRIVESEIVNVKRNDVVRWHRLPTYQNKIGFRIQFEDDSEGPYRLKLSLGDEISILPISLVSIKKHTSNKIINKFGPQKIAHAFEYMSTYGLRKLVQQLQFRKIGRDRIYHEWFLRNTPSEEELKQQREKQFSFSPKISIIVATFNTKKEYLDEMIKSVQDQTYPNWELCIGDGSTNNKVEHYIQKYIQDDSRIKYKKLEKNYGISGNMNGALSLATGDYISLFDHDDLLTPDCLYEIVDSMQETHHDVVYTDEDKLDDVEKIYCEPHFKPDFAIDQLRSHNYITHFFVVSKDIVDRIGNLRSEYDGSQDHDFIFRCTEVAKSIHHIPKILYHWRMHPLSTAQNPESKMYCYEAGVKAVQSHLKRIGLEGEVDMLPRPLFGMYKVSYTLKEEPKISILIPNMDHIDLLDQCIDSLYKLNTYRNFEVIIIENNSQKQETFDYYKKISDEYPNIKIVEWNGPFNYSAINNYGAKFAEGEYILLLNNDTEMIEPDSLKEMVSICQRKDIGAVGAKLLYEDDSVQHAGVIIGYRGYASNAFTRIDRDSNGYMCRPLITSNYSAVTAACLMVKKSDFDQVGGLDESFVVACNDVDFCLKLRKIGKLNVLTPFSLWYHYESKSRGYEDSPEKLERFNNEVAKFQKKWPEILKNGDPFYNPNFELKVDTFQLDLEKGRTIKQGDH